MVTRNLGDHNPSFRNSGDTVVIPNVVNLSQDPSLGTGAVSATELATDAVETIKIKDANVTAAKLAATLDLSTKTITLPNTSVTDAMLSNTLDLAAKTITLGNTEGGVIGTAGTNVTAVHYGEGYHHTTVLTLTDVAIAIAAAADEGNGALIYTFPAGVHIHEVSYMSVALQGGGTVNADTPDIGIGSVIASGANALLSAVGATSEDYITGQTAADCNGTATVVGPLGATAGILTGISLNAAADVKAVYLNVADGWAGTDTVAATGTVVLKWSKIA